MATALVPEVFPHINRAFADVFRPGRLSVGLVVPLEAYPGGPVPTMDRHIERRVGGGMDLLPKPTGPRLPILVTGGSRQPMAWSAEHADGWITYPRGIAAQARVVHDWRQHVEAAKGPSKPVAQSLYVDLVDDPSAPPQPIHLGFRSGTRALLDYLRSVRAIGVHHVAINLRFNGTNVESTLDRLAGDVLPELHEETP